jgi:uncharacterized protein YjiS (DUF1127 family)
MTYTQARLAIQPAVRSPRSIALRLLRNWLFRLRLAKLTNQNNRTLQDIGLRREDMDWALSRPLAVDRLGKLKQIVLRHTD